MNRKIKICDRCGETIAYNRFPVSKVTKAIEVKVYGFGTHDYASSDYDLCPACSRAFVDFMRGIPSGKESEGEHAD